MATKERLSYATVLVEIDASKDLVRTVKMSLPSRKSRIQNIVYENEPKFCGNCKMFEHTTSSYGSRTQTATRNQAAIVNTKLVSGDKKGQSAGKISKQADFGKGNSQQICDQQLGQHSQQVDGPFIEVINWKKGTSKG